MGYVPVKGGGTAIAEAENLLNVLRTRGALSGENPLTLDQIQHQLHFMHSQVLSEGGLYDEQLASLALKQSLGEAITAKEDALAAPAAEPTAAIVAEAAVFEAAPEAPVVEETAEVAVAPEAAAPAPAEEAPAA